MPLLLFKLPWQITNQLVNGTFSIQQTIRSLLARSHSSNSRLLVAQNHEDELLPLEGQNNIDEETLQTPLLAHQQEADSCLAIGNIYSEEELEDGLQDIKG
ncbi:MAG: hypothetical protein LBH96_06185 [Candidatus Peribacteria bacterium]|nr:hypothetical protein [Candidatus Peribacteria bacterium]